MHIRTWFGEDAKYIYNKFKKGEYSVDDIVEYWNDGLGERDTDESEEIDAKDFDELYSSSDKEYLIGFSNMDDENCACCDIFEVTLPIKVIKKSKKPFKSGLKINTVKGITINPNVCKIAYTFVEDDSVVNVDMVVPFF